MNKYTIFLTKRKYVLKRFFHACWLLILRKNPAGSGKPPVVGEKAQLRNALMKIRAMTPVHDPEHPNHRLAEIRETADLVLDYTRAYHTGDYYLRPEVEW